MLRHFDENGIEYVDLNDYAVLVGRSPSAVRASVLEGNRYRKLQHIREGTHIFIRKDEYYIYPYVASGKNATVIYHYEENNKLVACEECTQGKRCPKLDEKGNYIGHTAWRQKQRPETTTEEND